VTVGTHNQGFDRLVKKADILAKKLKEEIIIQKGHTKYSPVNCRHFDFADQNKFEKLCKEASIVITHGGVGSIITPLKMGKRIIVVPREKRFGEHTDDHQIQITKELERGKRIIAVYNINNLEEAIKNAKKQKPNAFDGRGKIQFIVREFLGKYENRNSA